MSTKPKKRAYIVSRPAPDGVLRSTRFESQTSSLNQRDAFKFISDLFASNVTRVTIKTELVDA